MKKLRSVLSAESAAAVGAHLRWRKQKQLPELRQCTTLRKSPLRNQRLGKEVSFWPSFYLICAHEYRPIIMWANEYITRQSGLRGGWSCMLRSLVRWQHCGATTTEDNRLPMIKQQGERTEGGIVISYDMAHGACEPGHHYIGRQRR